MKKKVAIFTTVAVLAVAAIGSTLAYFNAQTGTIEQRD
jgi:predicted ribosomally synthesized peptide with SipW-like signal peptide